MCILCWAFATFSATGGADGSAATGASDATRFGHRPAPVGDWFSHYAQSGSTDGSGQSPRGYDSHYREGAPAPPPTVVGATDPRLGKPGEERFLSNIRQLTFGQPADAPAGAGAANYAEAYWAPDGKSIVLQSTRGPLECDHIFTLDLVSNELTQISSGAGRTTCGFYDASGGKLIYSSTHETLGADCPPRPDMSQGYVWPIYDYNIYLADAATGGIERNITGDAGAGSYNAEGTIDWNGGWLYFTSTRDGDLDIYRQHLETGEVQRLTDSLGYDGGPFISYDGQTVVFRRDALETDEERADYTNLLAQDLVRPSNLEIWAMDADGGNQRQLTSNGKANFAPFLHPDNETIIFCSNVGDTQSGRTFELWAMPLDGSKPPVQITHGGEFDGFPMFSPDGQYIVWCSNRNGAQPRETNVFVAKWLGIDWDSDQ